MRLLALDVGEKRIGLASGAAGLDAALPAGVLLRRRLGLDVQAGLAAAARRRADAIVVGVPIRPGGGESSQTRRVRGFVKALRRAAAIPVYTVDEAFTSFEAEGLLREVGLEPSRCRGAVDAAAAALILRRFLEMTL